MCWRLKRKHPPHCLGIVNPRTRFLGADFEREAVSTIVQGERAACGASCFVVEGNAQQHMLTARVVRFGGDERAQIAAM